METMTAIDGLEALARLEQRIVESVEQLRAARRERDDSQKEASALRDRLQASEQKGQRLAAEIETLRQQRLQITERLEKLLHHIDLVRQG